MVMEIKKDNVFLIRKYICHDFCSTDNVASNISLGSRWFAFPRHGFFFFNSVCYLNAPAHCENCSSRSANVSNAQPHTTGCVIVREVVWHPACAHFFVIRLILDNAVHFLAVPFILMRLFCLKIPARHILFSTVNVLGCPFHCLTSASLLPLSKAPHKIYSCFPVVTPAPNTSPSCYGFSPV